MAASKKKTTTPKKKAARKPGAALSAGAQRRSSSPSESKLWVIPVGMLLLLVAVGAFVVGHARYLASLKFDMVRTAHVVPQGRDQGQGTALVNLAGDKQGHMFMLESEATGRVRLQRFDAQNSPATLVYTDTKPGEDLAAAVDVDCDPHGTIYVLLKDGRVQILSNDLKYVRSIQTGIAGATALAVSSAGRIFVADNVGNKVVYFDASGRREGDFGAPGQGDVGLVAPILMRENPDDELLVVESTPTGMRGRIFAKDLGLRKTFLIDKIQGSPWVRVGVNSQDKAFFNDQAGSMGIVCWNLDNGKYFGSSQGTKDGVKFESPGCIGANRYTPDVYVHTIPGLVKCVLPSPGDGGGQ